MNNRDDLFEKMVKFAEYCFNRAHSAAYAFVAYQTAYLKAHYPVEYICAMLTNSKDNMEGVNYFGKAINFNYVAVCITYLGWWSI